MNIDKAETCLLSNSLKKPDSPGDHQKIIKPVSEQTPYNFTWCLHKIRMVVLSKHISHDKLASQANQVEGSF